MGKGRLFMIPTVISGGTETKVLPDQISDEIKGINYFMVVNVRTARRYLSSLRIFNSIEELHFEVLDKKTTSRALERLFVPLVNGFDMGIISESGCPGVADPGGLAVEYAHRLGVKVVPLVGPSSILLALMASGLNGQGFAFNGYLPIEMKLAISAIKDFEKISRQRNQTQIFIETPYRNQALFAKLMKGLAPETKLCVAIDLTGKGENIRTTTINEWRRSKAELPKLPTLFLFHA
jgi:16S rRNA (cytidine1402-2'-O)-methyltransferase